MGHIQTAVNVSESDGMVQMTVAISMPPGTGPIETSFNPLHPNAHAQIEHVATR